MASTTGNEVELPVVIQNGVDNIPDADQVMSDFDKCNDKIFRSVTAPSIPYLGQFWVKSDEPEDSPLQLQMWTGTKWKAVQLNDIA